MKKYRKTETRYIPIDGDIITVLYPVYDASAHCFRNERKCFRIKKYKNSTVSALAVDCMGKPKHITLVNNPCIIASYTKV